MSLVMQTAAATPSVGSYTSSLAGAQRSLGQRTNRLAQPQAGGVSERREPRHARGRAGARAHRHASCRCLVDSALCILAPVSPARYQTRASACFGHAVQARPPQTAAPAVEAGGPSRTSRHRGSRSREVVQGRWGSGGAGSVGLAGASHTTNRSAAAHRRDASASARECRRDSATGKLYLGQHCLGQHYLDQH